MARITIIAPDKKANTHVVSEKGTDVEALVSS